MDTDSWFTVKPGIVPELEHGFVPAALFNKLYQSRVDVCSESERLVMAFKRGDGEVTKHETRIFCDQGKYGEISFFYIERIVKFLLWAKGAGEVLVSGPDWVVRRLRNAYSQEGPRKFDFDLMSKVYGRPFRIELVPEDHLPDGTARDISVGGNWNGCRIGFDLGASDYKVVALIDGQEVYSSETPWNPGSQADPDYHFDTIKTAITKAAENLPRIDCIGGSSAGIILNNRVMVSSIFRAVPPDRYADGAQDIFLRLADVFKVPSVVINDGDVTALAGALSLNLDGILGIAMGSSQAAGYASRFTQPAGWLNELAFAPLDYASNAPCDEWSGDRGLGVSYLSQQAVNRLLTPAGIAIDQSLSLAERLAVVQELVRDGHPGALAIFRTIGVYLGYAVAHYSQFYKINHLLVLGRVVSGPAGEFVLSMANAVLREDFPMLADELKLHLPDEQSRRVGQARAAASLPVV